MGKNRTFLRQNFKMTMATYPSLLMCPPQKRDFSRAQEELAVSTFNENTKRKKEADARAGLPPLQYKMLYA